MENPNTPKRKRLWTITLFILLVLIVVVVVVGVYVVNTSESLLLVNKYESLLFVKALGCRLEGKYPYKASPAGFLTYWCLEKTTDAGQSCSDDSQCKAGCTIYDETGQKIQSVQGVTFIRTKNPSTDPRVQETGEIWSLPEGEISGRCRSYVWPDFCSEMSIRMKAGKILTPGFYRTSSSCPDKIF